MVSPDESRAAVSRRSAWAPCRAFWSRSQSAVRRRMLRLTDDMRSALHARSPLPPPAAARRRPAGSDELLGRFLDYVAGKGLDALPGPGGGDPRAVRGQERHPEHADRLRASRWSPPPCTSPRSPTAGAPSTPARSRRWSTRSGWPSAASWARRTSASPPATPPSTATRPSSAAPRRCWPTSRCATAPTRPWTTW